MPRWTDGIMVAASNSIARLEGGQSEKNEKREGEREDSDDDPAGVSVALELLVRDHAFADGDLLARKHRLLRTRLLRRHTRSLPGDRL